MKINEVCILKINKLLFVCRLREYYIILYPDLFLIKINYYFNHLKQNIFIHRNSYFFCLCSILFNEKTYFR